MKKEKEEISKKSKNHSKKETFQKFPGFPKEPATNYWPYPRVMDGFWHILTGSEQKVLDYILRHTWGFKKTYDFISYRQFQHGIQKKDGKWLDKGCGIKHRITLRKAIDGLVYKGFLEAKIYNGRTSFFRLRWSENEPLVQGMNITGSESEHVGGSKNEPTIKDITKKELPIKESSVSLRSTEPLSSFKVQPPSEASPNTQEEKKNNPGVEKVINFFLEACESIRNFKPRISRRIEVNIIEKYLKEFSVEDLMDELDWFLKSEECDKLGCTIKLALSSYVFNRWQDQREV